FSTTDATVLREDQTAGRSASPFVPSARHSQAESLDATVLKPVGGAAGVPSMAVSETVEHTQARPVVEPEAEVLEPQEGGARRSRLPLILGSAVAGVLVVVAVAVLGNGLGTG